MADASSRSPIRAPSSSCSPASARSPASSTASRRSAAATRRSPPSGSSPAVLMGLDVLRLLERADEMREACRLEEGNPGLELGLAARRGLARRAATRCSSSGDFGLWVEQLLAESTGKEGKGLIPVACGRVRRRAAPRVPARRSVRGRPGVLPLGVRDGGRRLDPRASTRSTSPTCRRRRTRRTRSSRAAASRRSSRRATSTRCSTVRARATTSASRRSSTRRARAELEPLVERARATGRPVAVGLGPRYLHSTGQLHKGGPDTGLFVQVVDDLGEELPIPGRPFGFRKLIAAQAAGDYEALKERGRRISEGDRCEVRDGRARPHGLGDDRAPAPARARGDDLRPERRVDGGLARGARDAARAAARASG